MANIQSGVMSIVPNSAKSFGALQSHAFVPADANKLLLEMFGRPDGPYMLSNESLQRNLQPDDILRQYVDRELTLFSQAVTAAVANDRSSIMLLIFPVVETLETQFSIQYLEPNMVPWSRVTNFGIPRELTFSQWGEAYTTQRKKQMARIEKNFLLDKNYGPQYWDLMTRTLGGNAKMTLVIDACVQSIEQPFRNMFQDQNKRNAFDHNRLFNAEVADFGIAGRNQDLFYKALVKQKPGQLPIPFNTILGPEGVFQQLKENASDGGPIPCERAELSAETNRILSVVVHGPSSTKNIIVGGRHIACIEVPPQYCNMQDTTVKVFRPFETSLTYADVIPLDIGSSIQQFTDPVAHRFDKFAYAQTQTHGHQERFEFRRALDNIWLYHPITGEPSAQYESFIRKLNTDMVQHGVKAPSEWDNTTDINDEPVYGVDRFTPDMIKDARGDLRAMRGFRDQFPFATFDPLQRRWRMPQHMGDMHQRQLSNERFRQAAQIVLSTLSREEASTTVFNDIVDLVSAIRRQHWSARFVDGLIRANEAYLIDGGSILPDTADRNVRDNVPQWTPNEFGSLRIPSAPDMEVEAGGLPIETYPPGFGSWSGIQTLALEADKVDSIWRLAGEHARRVVGHVERLYTVLAQYVTESEIVDGRNTAPWFHVDDGGRSVLLDTIVQLKTGEKRPNPIMLAPQDGGGDDARDVVPPADVTAKITDAHLPTKDNLESGRVVHMDAWLALGAVIPASGMAILAKIALLLNRIEALDVTIKQNGVVSTSAGARVVGKIRQDITAALMKLSPLTNSRLLPEVEALLKAEEDKKNAAVVSGTPMTDAEYHGNLLMALYNAVMQAKQVVPKKGEKQPEPYFDIETREKNLEDRRSDQLRGPPAGGVIREGRFMRAPLEATGNLMGITVATDAIGGGKVKAWAPPAPPGPPGGPPPPPPGVPVPVMQRFDIFAYPVALNAAVGASSMSSAANSGSAYGYRAGAGSVTSSLADMFANVMYAGQEEVSKTAHRRGYFPGAMGQDPMDVVKKTDRGIEIGGNDGSLFGPWSARLKWLHANVKNGIERLTALAIMLSRNKIQTHRALIDVGAALLRIDGWRTGITVKTAALVRLVRGASTAFTVLARISVVPTLEGVTGDFAVTGEMFHGIVFQNRRQIDLLMNAVLLQYMGGKGFDAVEMPEHLDLPADQAPSVLYFADSENAGKIEYPRHLLNENYYYQDNTVTPSPYRKLQYSEFARHVLGKRIDTFHDSHIEKSIYSGKVRRCLVGNLAATYGYNEATKQFSNRVSGSGVVGGIEYNTADAWRGYNGGVFPVLAEDRPTPN